MTVSEMLARMDSREMTEWRAFAQVEPIGDARKDIRAAMLATLLANPYRDADSHPAPFTVQDFLHDYWEKPLTESEITESWQSNKALIEGLAIAFAAKEPNGNITKPGN